MRASVNKTYLDILGSWGHHSGDHEKSAYSCLGNGKARTFLVVMVVCSEIFSQLCTRSRNAPYAAYRPFVAGCWLTTRHLLVARLRSPLLFHGKNGIERREIRFSMMEAVEARSYIRSAMSSRPRNFPSRTPRLGDMDRSRLTSDLPLLLDARSRAYFIAIRIRIPVSVPESRAIAADIRLFFKRRK